VVQPGNGQTSKGPPPSEITPEQVREAKPDFTMTAKALLDEQKDDASARAKYEDKIIEVTGVVGACGETAAEEAFLILDRHGLEEGLVCVAQQKETWARHARGQKVKVRGVWRCRSDVGVGLQHAIVLESDPNPAPLYLAELLANQFQSDA